MLLIFTAISKLVNDLNLIGVDGIVRLSPEDELLKRKSELIDILRSLCIEEHKMVLEILTERTNLTENIFRKHVLSMFSLSIINEFLHGNKEVELEQTHHSRNAILSINDTISTLHKGNSNILLGIFHLPKLNQYRSNLMKEIANFTIADTVLVIQHMIENRNYGGELGFRYHLQTHNELIRLLKARIILNRNMFRDYSIITDSVIA